MTAPRHDLELHWLPPPGDYTAGLARALSLSSPSELFECLVELGNRRLDFLQTARLARAVEKAEPVLARCDKPRIRVALIGSATLDHLVPGVRVGALRRGLLVDTWVAPYGQWQQEILRPNSDLAKFRPDVVMLSIDGRTLVPNLPLSADSKEAAIAIDTRIEELTGLWRAARERLKATLIQQTCLSSEPAIFGNFERLLPATPAALTADVNRKLAAAAAQEGVLLFDLAAASQTVGTSLLCDPMLWHHAKQEITPAAVPWAGDQIGRILAAIRGLSKKVLVLDLDNTLWGGVIGDDGLEGIALGQGSALGEAYLAFQRYLKRLSERGVVLAVSSKNERATAEQPFRSHPEMVLRLEDIAAFEANWDDKPAALRRIATDLNLGIDSFVFFDDNPAERDLMRRSLPDVTVPEVPDAPEHYATCLADAGYFEAVTFTKDDLRRTEQYGAEQRRRELQTSTADIEGFLRSLNMSITVIPFRTVDIARITQLINKTNQFNLTTRRYSEAEIRAATEDPEYLTFSARLRDRFGENGIVSIVIGRIVRDEEGSALDLETWLMSCRVLGRKVENALFAIVADAARRAGIARLVGRYRPTSRNAMVRSLYEGFGFKRAASAAGDDEQVWSLHLALAEPEMPDCFRLNTELETG